MLSPSEDHMLKYGFTVNVNENQIDATFIALGIYLKLLRETVFYVKKMDNKKQNFLID